MRYRINGGKLPFKLLVVMVIIALLIGLLLPALSRANEEARKTQCRSNLRQIGLAMQMYASDNGDYWPAFGGGTRRSNASRWDPAYWGVLRRYAVITNAVIVGQAQYWHVSPTRPARPVGLGLLYGAGYLTSKGAQVLYCPSDNSSQQMVKEGRNRSFRYDYEEPFWTSKGTITRSNGNGVGDFVSRTQSAFPFGCWGYYCFDTYASYQANDGVWNRNGGGITNMQWCIVTTNYNLRFTSKFGAAAVQVTSDVSFPDNAAKLEEVGKIAVVADNLNLVKRPPARLGYV